MGGELINLRRARKAKARAQAAAEADVRRAQFGRSKADKAQSEAERRREADGLDAHRLDPPEPE